MIVKQCVDQQFADVANEYEDGDGHLNERDPVLRRNQTDWRGRDEPSDQRCNHNPNCEWPPALPHTLLSPQQPIGETASRPRAPRDLRLKGQGSLEDTDSTRHSYSSR